jgi:hypothetical protein
MNSDAYSIFCDNCGAKSEITETQIDSYKIEVTVPALCPRCASVIKQVRIKGYVTVVLTDHRE